MKKIYLVIAIIFTSYAYAGFDFNISKLEVSLKTNDNEIVKNAQFEYNVFSERNEIPCTSDGYPTGPSCWRASILKNDKLNTGDIGVATIPAQHFHSNSLLERSVKAPLSVNLWGVFTPFMASNGKQYNCIAIQPYTLQQSNIEMSYYPNFVINLSKSELQEFVNEKIEICKKNIDSGKYQESAYVLPY